METQEIYNEYRTANRFMIGWLLLLVCAVLYILNNGSFMVIMGSIALAVCQRARSLTRVPLGETPRKDDGSVDYGKWFSQWLNRPSFGETMRDKIFSTREFLSRMLLGMLPWLLGAVVISVVTVKRIGLPPSFSDGAPGLFFCVPVLVASLYGVSIEYCRKKDSKFSRVAERVSGFAVYVFSVWVLIDSALVIYDGYCSEYLRMALSGVDRKERAIVFWESGNTAEVIRYQTLLWFAVVAAVLLFLSVKSQIWKVIVYTVCVVVIAMSHHMTQCNIISLDSVTSRNGIFKSDVTEYSLDEAQTFTINITKDRFFNTPVLEIEITFDEGVTFSAQWRLINYNDVDYYETKGDSCLLCNIESGYVFVTEVGPDSSYTYPFTIELVHELVAGGASGCIIEKTDEELEALEAIDGVTSELYKQIAKMVMVKRAEDGK